MQDNGLLFSSANCWDKDGNLVLDRKNWYDAWDADRHIYSCRDSGSGKRYFVKKCYSTERTAEVLLSQVYAKHGFTTAIALPSANKR